MSGRLIKRFCYHILFRFSALLTVVSGTPFTSGKASTRFTSWATMHLNNLHRQRGLTSAPQLATGTAGQLLASK